MKFLPVRSTIRLWGRGFWDLLLLGSAIACDYGTIHSYAGGKQSTVSRRRKWILAAELMCPNQPIMTTKTS